MSEAGDETPYAPEGKIVHIVSDEKFIDAAFRAFQEVAPDQNLLALYGERRELRYIKSREAGFYSTWRLRQLLRSNACAAVVFHGLDRWVMPILGMIPPEKPVLWVGWGYDYYAPLLSAAYPDGMLLEATRRLAQERPKDTAPPAKRRLIRIGKELVKRMYGVSTRYEVTDLQRVDYFAPVLDVEYDMAVRMNPWFRPRYIAWNYSVLDDARDQPAGGGVALGENILVGNSASLENNHLDIFALIAQHVDLSRHKIIVPLSYGDPWYRDQVVAAGRDSFGDDFLPITTFMDRDEYSELLQSCGYVFMHHVRQQGMGNIVITLLKGAKIFLHPANPAYRWLLDRGCTVESSARVSETSDGGRVVLEPLTDDERGQNASAILQIWGSDALRAKTRHVVEVAFGRHEGRLT